MSNIKMGLTIEEAAECTGIGRNTMRKLVDWGKLPVLKVGRKAIIRRDTLERFMSVNQGRNLLNENDVRKVEYPQRVSRVERERLHLHPSLWMHFQKMWRIPAGWQTLVTTRRRSPRNFWRENCGKV